MVWPYFKFKGVSKMYHCMLYSDLFRIWSSLKSVWLLHAWTKSTQKAWLNWVFKGDYWRVSWFGNTINFESLLEAIYLKSCKSRVMRTSTDHYTVLCVLILLTLVEFHNDVACNYECVLCKYAHAHIGPLRCICMACDYLHCVVCNGAIL